MVDGDLETKVDLSIQHATSMAEVVKQSFNLIEGLAVKILLLESEIKEMKKRLNERN